MIHLLIADAKNRLQFAEKWGWVMIKEPPAEKTVTGIQPSVPKRIQVITVEDQQYEQKMYHQILKLKLLYKRCIFVYDFLQSLERKTTSDGAKIIKRPNLTAGLTHRVPTQQQEVAPAWRKVVIWSMI